MIATTWRHDSLSGAWEQLQSAVLGRQKHCKQSLPSHTFGETKSVFKSVPCNGFFPKIGQSRFLLSRVLHGVGRAWVKRMRELCALYRTSGSNYSWLTSVTFRKASWLKMSEEQEYYPLPAGQMKTFLFIFGFSWFFFSLFEIFALLFFSSQILSLSLAFTVFDIKNLKWIPRSKRGRVTFHFDVLFFGREISVLGNWVPSLMKPGTRLCIGKKPKTNERKEMISYSSFGEG